MVALWHYAYWGPQHGVGVSDFGLIGSLAKYSYWAVDFLFMVSGAVIVLSCANKSAYEFAVARLVRVFPAYIPCLCISTALVIFSGVSVTLGQFAANLTAVAPVFGFKSVGSVYWALHFELAFYFAAFLVILVGLRERIEEVLFGWVALQVLLYPLQLPFFSGYFAIIASGGIVALIQSRGWSAARITALATAVVLSVLNASGRHYPDVAALAPVVVPALVASFFIFAKCRSLPAAPILGDIAYPLYLIHAEIGYLLLDAIPNQWLGLIASIAASLTVSLIVVQYFERPLKPLWRSQLVLLIGAAQRCSARVRKAPQA
jgi:peptidoglycan/LPS O-acetylase OafA/YrhL